MPLAFCEGTEGTAGPRARYRGQGTEGIARRTCAGVRLDPRPRAVAREEDEEDGCGVGALRQQRPCGEGLLVDVGGAHGALAQRAQRGGQAVRLEGAQDQQAAEVAELAPLACRQWWGGAKDRMQGSTMCSIHGPGWSRQHPHTWHGHALGRIPRRPLLPLLAILLQILEQAPKGGQLLRQRRQRRPLPLAHPLRQLLAHGRRRGGARPAA